MCILVVCANFEFNLLTGLALLMVVDIRPLSFVDRHYVSYLK